MEQNAQPVFAIEKLYVKDLSVEVPNAPEIFLEREQPQVEIQLNTGGRGIGDGVFEVILTVTVTATSREQLDALYRTLSTHPMVKVVL